MQYEGQICRPPMERSSFMLAVSVGCAYNQCTFCTLFKHLKYRILPMSQIEEELQRVKSVGGSPKRIFLGDGNPFGLQTAHLLEILERIHFYFPQCEEINMDATVTDIHGKTDEELHRLKAAGVCRLYLGIESGLDDVLRFMRKDHTLEQAYREIERLGACGLGFDAHMMTGIAGAGRGPENAEKTAEFFNRTRPGKITNFSLFLHQCAPLYQKIQAGEFTPANELENLMEERRLLDLLETDNLLYDGFHDMIEVRVKGTLPNDKEKMLQKLDTAIAVWEKREPVVAFVE